MENKTTKKLVKSAAVLSLTAVLASMPVSADGYAIADSSCAIAVANSTNVNASFSVCAELSCEYGGMSDPGTYSVNKGVYELRADVYASEAYQLGDLYSTHAEAWVNGTRVGYDYWEIGMPAK